MGDVVQFPQLGEDMKTQLPQHLDYRHGLAAAAVRNHWQSRRSPDHGTHLVRIGRAQGYQEALELLVGERTAKDLMFEVAKMAANDDELAAYLDAEMPATPEMVARRVERELDGLEKRWNGGALRLAMRGREGIVRWVLDRGKRVSKGVRV